MSPLNYRRWLIHFAALGLAVVAIAAEKGSRVPAWDARGLGALPWQGVACLDVSADGRSLVLGTIAPPGDPNVLVLDAAGQLARHYAVGQRWIQDVIAPRDAGPLFALCTMPAGRASDAPTAFRCAESVAPAGRPMGETDLAWTIFHYGEHSNHCGTMLRPWSRGAVGVWRDHVVWMASDSAPLPADVELRLAEHAVTVAFAAAPNGEAVVGVATRLDAPDNLRTNLFFVAPGEKSPRWRQIVGAHAEAAAKPAPGVYGTTTGRDRVTRAIEQQDIAVRAPLSIALHADAAGAARFVATANYPGWQRSLHTGGEDDLNRSIITRFVPAQPSVTVFDRDGAVVREFLPTQFPHAGWLDLKFVGDGARLVAFPHHWQSRGLAAQPFLPVDDDARSLFLLDVASGAVKRLEFPDAIADVAVSGDAVVASCWDGKLYRLDSENFRRGRRPAGIEVGAPCLLAASADGARVFAASNAGVVRAFDAGLRELWRTDLNAVAPHGVKRWVEQARAERIAPGLWRMPGGRVESDLASQWAVEAPEGLILIEAHSGLTFEGEWAALEHAGLDPRRVRWVLPTHEHGDHAPGAYLWRVVTGAQVASSDAMAYALQHTIPVGTGYGFNPPVPTDVRVEQDTDLNLAGLRVRAVSVPGHTPGSMAWLFEKEGKRFVATGDLIMPHGALGFSGSIGFSGYDILASLRKLDALHVDFVLPGHSDMSPPARDIGGGIAVARHVGWGKIPPEDPDPFFRITQTNVLVVAFACDATSADIGDVNGDGRPDVAVVSPRGDGSVVRIFLNKQGHFDPLRADFEIPVQCVSHPTKIRLRATRDERTLDIFVSGRGAALLTSRGRAGEYDVQSLDQSELHQIRMVDVDGRGVKTPLVAPRFGVVRAVRRGADGRVTLGEIRQDVRGPYIDFQELDLNGDGRPDLISAYGGVWLRGEDGRLPDAPTQQLARLDPSDWSYLGVGDFNGDGKPDAAFISYGMNHSRVAVFSNTGRRDKPFADQPDTVIDLGTGPTHVRDAPAVADWNGDGMDDIVVGMGQERRVRIFFGSKTGLSADRVQTIPLEFRLFYEAGLRVADFNGDGKPDLAMFGETDTGGGAGGPPTVYIWLQPK